VIHNVHLMVNTESERMFRPLEVCAGYSCGEIAGSLEIRNEIL
jgi:hypothetical protein